MGKNLIIKNADFSVNAIEKQYEWYVDDYSLSVQAGLSITVDVNLRRAGFSLPKIDTHYTKIKLLTWCASLLLSQAR